MTIIEVQHDPQALHTLYGETMGTRWRVCAVGRDTLGQHVLHAAIQSRLDDVVAQMSTWEPHSDISRYNAAAAGTWHALPADFDAVLTCALAIAEASDGAYDPTVGPLVALWGFGSHAGARRVPEQSDIDAARARSGWRRILLNASPRAVLQPGGALLDLSAIAKGYGVDAVVATLRTRGIGAALVDVGGELRGYGATPDGSPWRVLVESADDEAHETTDDEQPCVLTLDDVAVATSGDRWHAYDREDTRYAHTIDPRHGAPVRHAAASVTVLHRSAMEADAWATALTVMGGDAGLAFADANGLAARFVERRDGTLVVRTSAAFDMRTTTP